MDDIVLTAIVGNNSELIPEIFKLYIRNDDTIADVTYGKGTFWKNIDKSKYHVLESDLLSGVDFRKLPYNNESIDVLILDPPYMHDSKTVIESLNNKYHNNNGSHESVIRLYTGGLLEAARVLKKDGVIIVKCQDETSNHKQMFSHIELINLLKILGFAVVDLFVVVQNGTPIMRQDTQKSARKNHSYAIIGRFKA